MTLLRNNASAKTLLGQLLQEIHRLCLLRSSRTQSLLTLCRTRSRNLLPPYLALVLHSLVRLLLGLIPFDAIVAHELAIPNLYIPTLLGISKGLESAGRLALLLKLALTRPRVCARCELFHTFFLRLALSLTFVAGIFRIC